MDKIFNKSNILLLSLGLSLALFSIIKLYFNIDISSYLLFGLTIFTFVIALSELADGKRKDIIIFISIPCGLVATLFVTLVKTSGVNIQNYTDTFTILSLSVLIVSLALSDANPEKK